MRGSLPRVTRCAIACLAVAAPVAKSVAGEDARSEEYFEKHIRPILAGTCFRCHGDQKTSGKLRVDSRESLRNGGESGAAVVPGNASASLLMKAVERVEDVSAMPPDKPLPAEQVKHLATWIDAGAPWPKESISFDSAKHWAFQPVRDPSPPAVRDSAWSKSSIDPFILARLEQDGLAPLAPADRRTLLRRVTYDLTGLPPSPEEVAAFLADSSPNAFEKVVERLLDSPRYGEHWGRHWLDVVRYADTAGENTDRPLAHAWRYRNWVVESINDDKPYDQFLREQIAGDVLAGRGPPDEYADKIVATGYLAIARRFGHDIEKDMHLTYEDVIDTLGKSVLGLSLGCCRCHDHKYDPLTTADYYGLYGVFESSRFSYPGCEPKQKPRDMVALLSAGEIERTMAPYKSAAEKLDADLRRMADEEAALGRQFKEASAKSTRVLAKGQFDDGGSADLKTSQSSSLERIDVHCGELIVLSISPRGNHGADTTLVDFTIQEIAGEKRRWSVGDLVDNLLLGNPHSIRAGGEPTWCFLDLHDGASFLSENLNEVANHKELKVWRNGDTPSVLVNTAEQPVKVWTTLPPRTFFMHPGPNGPVGLAWISPVDATVRIRGRIADAHAGGGDGVGWNIEHIAERGASPALLALRKIGERRSDVVRQRDGLSKTMPTIHVAYAVVEGSAKDAKIQKRGEPMEPGDIAPRRLPELFGGAPLGSDKSSGRLELAEWLASPRNPLTARVMANRVWQWHFGRGLVRTPNDFGRRGTPPTHPELLDHLATDFVQSGWSIKALHRLIVLSATYQQSAAASNAPDLYRGFPCRRLCAEEIRDSLLAVSGELDGTPGQAHPFPPEESWSYTQHAPFAAEYETNKRSVYVMQKRNRRGRFFSLFDGADPNSSTAVRDVTTAPTQALYFLNDPFVHARAEKLAGRILSSAESEGDRLDNAYRTMFGRNATVEEQADAQRFLAKYAEEVAGEPETKRATIVWGAYARLLMTSNEFLYVD